MTILQLSIKTGNMLPGLLKHLLTCRLVPLLRYGDIVNDFLFLSSRH